MTVNTFRAIRLQFYRFFKAALARPRLTLLVFASITLGCLAMFPKLKMELRIYDIDDPHFVSTQRLRDVTREFKDGNSVLLFVRKRSGAPITAGEYCRIENWKEDQHRSNPDLISASGPSDVLVPVQTGTRLFYRRMLDLHCDSLTAVQAGEPVSFQAIRATPWGEVLTDPSGRDFAMQFIFRDLPATRPGQDKAGFNPDVIGNLLSDFRKNAVAPGSAIEAFLGGRAGFQWYQKQAIVHDLWVNALLIFLLIGLFRLSVGTWKSGMILVATLLVSITITYGGMALLGLPIDTLSNSLFLLLCIAGMEDFVFISHQHLAHPESWRRNFKAVLIPGFFTSFTTMIGFLSLCTSDIRIISRFGACAAFAALVEWAVTFFALPAFFAAFRRRGNWANAERAPLLPVARKLGKIGFSRRSAALAIGLAAISLVGFPFLRFEMSPRGYFPEGHPQRLTYEYTKSSRGWEGILLVVFKNAEDTAANEALLAKIRALPNVAHVDNPYDLPGFMTKGFSPPIAQLIRREISVSPAYSRLFSQEGRARASVYLRNFDLEPLSRTLSSIGAICQENCIATGEGAVFAEYSREVVRTLFVSFFTCLLLTGLVLSWLVFATGGTKREIASILFSSFWAPVVVIGALAVLRIPINYFNSMFATVLVGLTGDNAVQYLLASTRRRPAGKLAAGMAEKSAASVTVTCISGVASLCFFFMTPVPVRLLGFLLFVGFLASLTGDLWLLKGLLRGAGQSR